MTEHTHTYAFIKAYAFINQKRTIVSLRLLVQMVENDILQFGIL